jgi:hypothetical protein
MGAHLRFFSVNPAALSLAVSKQTAVGSTVVQLPAVPVCMASNGHHRRRASIWLTVYISGVLISSHVLA